MEDNRQTFRVLIERIEFNDIKMGDFFILQGVDKDHESGDVLNVAWSDAIDARIQCEEITLSDACATEAFTDDLLDRYKRVVKDHGLFSELVIQSWLPVLYGDDGEIFRVCPSGSDPAEHVVHIEQWIIAGDADAYVYSNAGTVMVDIYVLNKMGHQVHSLQDVVDLVAKYLESDAEGITVHPVIKEMLGNRPQQLEDGA